MPALSANGITIEYESLGNAADPAIVLIMGLGMQLVSWPDALCRPLVEAGYRVIRFDNRDCGLSSRVRGRRSIGIMLALAAARLGLPIRPPYTLEDMARDTVALMDALHIERAHVVGVSMGGMIAQVVAARFPTRVQSLTSIMSTSGNRHLSKPHRQVLKLFLRRPARSADVERAIDHLVEVFTVIGSPGFPSERNELRRRIGRAVRRSYDPAGTARQLVAIVASGDRRKLLGQITAPTLVIHGADDPLVPVDGGQDTARAIPAATLRIIDGMGHDLPDALMPTIAEAIVRHCRASVSDAPGQRAAR